MEAYFVHARQVHAQGHYSPINYGLPERIFHFFRRFIPDLRPKKAKITLFPKEKEYFFIWEFCNGFLRIVLLHAGLYILETNLLCGFVRKRKTGLFVPASGMAKGRVVGGLRGNIAAIHNQGNAPRRALARPRFGARGASGPGGRMLQEVMISKLNEIATRSANPNYALARKLSSILFRAREEQSVSPAFEEHQEALNRVMNKIISWKPLRGGVVQKPVKPTPEEARVLELFSKF